MDTAGWWRPIDAYCERLGPEFWAEPLNAVTNLSFLLAALFAWQRLRDVRDRDVALLGLIGLVVAIGVGSFLFHTVATAWAAVADVVPIQLFIVSYLILVLHRVLGLPLWAAIAVGIAFVPLAMLTADGLRLLVGRGLRGGEGYLPALAALLVCAAFARARAPAASTGLFVAAAIFSLSLTFRTLDLPLCPSWPLGTHFVWHLLNGLLLGHLVLVLARHPRRAQA